jgi:biotin operon repressor
MDVFIASGIFWKARTMQYPSAGNVGKAADISSAAGGKCVQTLRERGDALRC